MDCKFFANFNSDNIKTENTSGENIEGTKTNSISVGIINDRRDNIVDTKSGSLVKAELLSSQKLFGSDNNFTKLMIDARKYNKISPKDVFASRFMFNYSNNDLPIVEQFSIGGSDSVRGLDEGEQKGNKSILASVEYRHDINDKVQAEKSSIEEALSFIEQIKKEKIKYIFFEELVSPKVAETLSRETGAGLLLLNPAHNLKKEDFENKISFFAVMENNLINLKTGLSCSE